jgi:hypothetical protein
MREQVTQGEIAATQSFSDDARHYYRMPGIVQAFYPGVPGVSPPSVDVQPAVNDVRFDTTTGERYPEKWQVLYKVPVRFPTFGGYAIWGPLKKGDKVDLEGFDLDPGPYLATGQVSDPALTRRNGGAHWVAVPGDYTDPGALPDSGGAICIGTPGGVLVTITAAGVNVGSAAPPNHAALAETIDTLNVLLKTFATAMGAVPPAGPLAPLASAITAASNLAGGIPTTVASQTVKITP